MSDHDRVVALQEALKRLDEQYTDLETKESLLQKALLQLQRDEKCLQKGMEEAAPKRNQAEALATARLEQALLLNLGASSSSSEDEEQR